MLEFDGEGYLDIEHYYDDIFPMDYPDDIIAGTEEHLAVSSTKQLPDLPFIPF